MEPTRLHHLRFSELAGAYGGDIERWPASERLQAFALTIADPDRAGLILAEAKALDDLLRASSDPSPSLALEEAIIASAPRPRRAAPARRWAGIGLGASLAAASVAGVLIGFAAAPIAASHFHLRQSADTASEATRWLGEPGDMSEG